MACGADTWTDAASRQKDQKRAYKEDIDADNCLIFLLRAKSVACIYNQEGTLLCLWKHQLLQNTRSSFENFLMIHVYKHLSWNPA